MFLAHISDTHLAASGTSAPIRATALDRTIACLNALDPRPAAVLHTGDLTHNGRRNEYEQARTLLAKLEIPLVVAAGNRDRRDLLKAAILPDLALPSAKSFVQFAVDLPDLCIIVVDTTSDDDGLGHVCPDRLADLETMFVARAGRPTVVLMHHPPVLVPAARNPMQFRSAASAAAVVRLISRQSSILGVLAGHTHREDVLPLGPTHLSTVPSLATDLRKSRHPKPQSAIPMFHLHEVGQYGLRTRPVWVGPPA